METKRMRDITHVRYVAYGVPDVARAAEFYEKLWGLEVTGKDRDLVFLGGAGPDQYLVRLRSTGTKQMDLVALGARDAPAVDRLAQKLGSAGVKLVSEPGKLQTPGGGYGFRCFDPDGRLIEISSDVAERSFRPANPGEWRSIKISHAVLNTPDLGKAGKFYADLLGFRISDYLEDRMVFFQCQVDHHSIALAHAPHASINHVAYELRGIDELMKGTGHLKSAAGLTPVWGPGRHGAGNNVFSYFVTPDRFVAEYTCELDRILDEEKWPPKVWSTVPSDYWGVGKQIGPDVWQALAGEPDPALWKPSPV